MAKRSSSAASSGLAGMSVGELQAELNRRQRGASKLSKKRDRLAAKLAEVDAQIRAMGGISGGGGARGRARNTTSLVEALAKVLDGKVMAVTDAADAVQKAGYQTTSASFRTIVNQTLINSNKFKRASRGMYTLK